jgi:flagella basal body P-ring formation protein FlgA
MIMISKIIVLVSALCACCAGLIPVSIDFRDSASVNDTVIRLGDIAVIRCETRPDLIETLRNAVVGESAPAGYCRKVNPSDVVTYALRKAGNEFSFGRVRDKPVMVATKCVEKKVGDFEQLIVKYFADSVKWQPKDYAVTVRNADEKWKCLDKPIEVRAAGLLTGYPKGNVNIKLVMRQYSRVFSIPVVCLVTVVTPVVAARTAIPRGTPLTRENCIVARKDITRFACNPYTDLSQLNDHVANRSLQAETIIHDKLTSRIPIIGKDEQVYVVVDRGQVRVSIIMRAREQGGLGDKIWVENEITHKLLKTKIIGKGKVELLEGVRTI